MKGVWKTILNANIPDLQKPCMQVQGSPTNLVTIAKLLGQANIQPREIRHTGQFLDEVFGYFVQCPCNVGKLKNLQGQKGQVLEDLKIELVQHKLTQL